MAGKPSKAAVKAAQYLEKHPDTSGPDLAKRFDISVAAIYASPFWKTRKAVKAMNLKVTHDGERPGEVRERCCMCRAHTNYWYAPKDVALCQVCAKTTDRASLPTKAEWIAKEESLSKPRIIPRHKN